MPTVQFEIWDKEKQVLVADKDIAIKLNGDIVATDEFWLEHNLNDLIILVKEGN